jgi:Peptidyl-prolyl cis-trans isomerase (rotamase) - cyclophilin family
MRNPIATIQMENRKTIKIELYQNVTPKIVNNFISLVQRGFYNGLIFHRVASFSHIQTGCPKSDKTGNIVNITEGELTSLKLERGLVAMVTYNKTSISATQFIIMVTTPPLKAGEDAIFGRVVEGMDEVDRIAKVEVDQNLKPIVNQIITSIAVESQ